MNVEPGCTASIDGTELSLVQFHYHAPSEHTFDGQTRAVEWHFVHQSAAKNIGVLAVFAVAGPENPAFDSVLAAAPGQVGTSSPVDGAINVAAMLPADLNALRYGGSLTTPPCTEPVRWTLLPAPVSMSQKQIATVQDVVDHNDRPIQPLNGRTLQHALVTT